MKRARKAVAPIALAILVGCGGSGGKISNAAHLRFFNALNDSGSVRLYVGDRLYRAGGDASIANGDDARYGDVPSGTALSLVVNQYTDLSNDTATALASATGQTFLSGRSYTAVALLVGTARRLVVLSDNSELDGDTSYFRIVNANNTTTPLYLRVVEKDGDYVAYETSSATGLASGANTGIQQDYFSDSDAHDVIIRVYRDADFTDEIASKTVTITPGKSVTTFVYNRSSGGGLAFESSTDRDDNVTSTPTTTGGDTTGTTGTDGTTSTTTSTTAGTTGTDGTTSTTGTTATDGTTTTTG